MITLGEQSMILFESMPKHLSSAEKYLDQAEIDFTSGAVAPFWDSIENAARTLRKRPADERAVRPPARHEPF